MVGVEGTAPTWPITGSSSTAKPVSIIGLYSHFKNFGTYPGNRTPIHRLTADFNTIIRDRYNTETWRPQVDSNH